MRACARFELFAYDALDEATKRRLVPYTRDDDFFGVLVSRDGALPKAVSNQGALLFLALHRPQALPSLLRTVMERDPEILRRLVLDGVLELEDEGGFVSGPAALSLFSTVPRSPASHPLARTAHDAVACAAGYEGLEAGALALRVYQFGRLPCTPALRRRFMADADLVSFLTSETDAVARIRGWNPPHAEGAWLQWSNQHATHAPAYKLYVSARLVAMPRAFALTLEALDRTTCGTFKVGRGGEGVCRPDKLIAYFNSFDELRACATILEGAFAAAFVGEDSAHGVPLTAPVDAAGYISWGMDPPELASTVTGLRESWRKWLAARVAGAVLSAKRQGSEDDLVAFVLERLELDGVDTSGWTPTQALWRGHAARQEDVA